MSRRVIESLVVCGVVSAALVGFAVPAVAQPYPTDVQPGYAPPQPVNDPYAQPDPPQYDTTAQAAAAYDPTQDYDPDIDGYDVDYDIRYDNAAAESYDDGYDPNAYAQFETSLSPYGQWVDDGTYGHVWVPSVDVVGTAFSPYATGGHWVLSEYGWTWVSDWDWGWAPFHYGRWVSLAAFGWCWVPGSLWGPAWVTWRSGGGYVGWAPLPPRGVTVGPPTGVRSPWRFTVASHLGSPRMNYIPAHTVPTIFARTQVVSNARSVTIAGARVNVNAGPVGLASGVTAPVSLHTVAPRALPQAHIAPRPGVPVASRPWARAATAPRSIPIGPQHYAPPAPRYTPPTYRAPQPIYRAPTSVAPQYHYNAPQPAYRPPVQAYRQPQPVYRAPQPSYHYSAPSPSYHYAAPTPSYHYSAPTPSYHYSAPAPSYHYSAPTYSAPSYHYSAPSSTVNRPSTTFSHPAPVVRGRR